MQSLRDKLLKAGAVSKAEARKARTEARQKKKKGREGQKEAAAQQRERKAAFEAKRAQEAESARARQEELNAEAERKAAEARLRDLIERHVWRKVWGDERVFHFVGADRRIRRIYTNAEVAEKLVAGRLGIVAAPYDARRDYRIVLPEGLQKLAEEAPAAILFWNRDRGSDGGPTFGAQGPGVSEDDETP